MPILPVDGPRKTPPSAIKSMVDTRVSSSQETQLSVETLLQDLSSEQFREWYHERQYRENIQNGQAYFNGPGSIPPADRHTPSQLLQCQRKILYRKENAPSERADPRGIFWFGERFEEDLLFPFLERTVTTPETYVQNSIWIDFTAQTKAGDLRIKGSTDPVLVDSEAVPILPTEAKTKSSADDVSEPNPHHKAQIHAYMVGLSEKFDKDLSDAVIIYGGRESLDLKVFHITFDTEFWNDVVLDWAADHTEYRVDGELPPADPQFDWECRFCSYRNRCGKGSSSHGDYPPAGLLADYDGYPREKLIEYLEGHPEESLTPTLADQYPELVDAYGVSDWHCRSCESEISWQDVDETLDDPLCPRCAERGDLSALALQRESQPKSPDDD